MRFSYCKMSAYSYMAGLLIGLSVIVFSAVSPLTAQTLPPFKPALPEALKKEAPFSPNNMASYREMVAKYAVAACLQLKSVSDSGDQASNREIAELRQKMKTLSGQWKTELDGKTAEVNELQKKIAQLEYQANEYNKLSPAEALQFKQGRHESERNQAEILKAQYDKVTADLEKERKKKKSAARDKRIKSLEESQAWIGGQFNQRLENLRALEGEIQGLEGKISGQKDTDQQLTEARQSLSESKKHASFIKEQLAVMQSSMEGASTNGGCDPVEATRLRNNLIFLVIAQADTVFINSRAKRRGWTDVLDAFMDFLQIGLTTSATISNGARAKSVLSSLSTLIQGSHSVLQKDFKLKENQIYFNTMEAKRAKIFKEILDNMKEPDSSYSFPMALLDIMKYSKAGTLDDAMSELAASTGKQKQDEETNVVDSKKVLIGSVATKDEETSAVGARDTLKTLLGQLDSKDTEVAAGAKSKLIAIAGQIAGDDTVKKEAAANPEFATLLTDLANLLKKEPVDGKAVAEQLNEIHGAARENPALALAIQKIITKADTK